MRVRISTNLPLPPVKAWLPLDLAAHSTQIISSFKSILCTSIPALRDFSPCSLHLSIDGFELLDSSELSVVRDGDLIYIDVLDTITLNKAVSQSTQNQLDTGTLRKRKRRVSSSSSSSSESTSESKSSTESKSEASSTDSESDSDSDDSSRLSTQSVRKADHPKAHVKPIPPAQPKTSVIHPATFVPPGYGKPQTRSRNLRRRLKRMHERKTTEDGPVSGANAVVRGKDGQASIAPDANGDRHATPEFMSLSLRSKNKAKNFKSMIKRPLPPKIIFEEQQENTSAISSHGMPTPQVMPRLIPPSERSSLPPNVFVTSVDVEYQGETMDIEPEEGIEVHESGVDVESLESIAEKYWDVLSIPTREDMEPGVIVGYKGLGINQETYTPEQVLTVGVVVSCGEEVAIQPLRAASFSGPVDAEVVRHTWEEIGDGDWKIIDVAARHRHLIPGSPE